mmetsp:Transcript_18584/g.22833  ORF Transcript_18584/g.22833 Transcript_18584/m.22833 type:complete len:593 (+) Transcript_18584:126-1904(+)
MLETTGDDMDVVAAAHGYLDRLLSNISGMKALVLDSELTGITAMAYSQSNLLQKNVVLTTRVEKLRNDAEVMKHLKCVMLLRPNRSNVDFIRNELRTNPKYGEYHIFFSNILPVDLLQQLAQADDKQLVKQVQECFADFYPISRHLFSLNIENSLKFSTSRARWSRGEEMKYQRAVQGLGSVLLAFKRKPLQIRYQRKSNTAMNFAREIRHLVETEKELFDFRGNPNTLLLILDRRDDPITPLLTQWTYQAMVHELFCIHNNRVDLRKHNQGGVGLSQRNPEIEQIVLSETDQFFADHMYSNFGDLGEAIKGLLDSYQKLSKSNRQISTVEDMQKFVDSYPEFKKFANNVSKHVALMGELAHLVDSHRLLDISQLEQELSCIRDHANQLEEVRRKIQDTSVDANDALRLVLLYALRYESHTNNQLRQLKHLLLQKGLSQLQVSLVDAILDYAGEKKRAGDLYGESSLISKSLKMATRAVKGVSNVYTQHKPVLAEILEAINKGRLKDSDFPIMSSTKGSTSTGSSNTARTPKEVIVFMVGGTTFEESMTVHNINKSGSGINVVLGGTCIHNSTSFTTEVNDLLSRGAGSSAS